MRNFEEEIKKRVEFIQRVVKDAGADGIVYGNSGGKDSALTGILCKKACDKTIALVMPCGSKQNYGSDMNDAMALAGRFGIEVRKIDLTQSAEQLKRSILENTALTDSAAVNIPPRLRMASLYAVAASENCLVAGTGNRSEAYMGYFTKWGDGAFDLNPIADLTVTEIFEFLRYLGAPEEIITKAPSAGLYDGQTDEKEMGVTYKAIDGYLLSGICSEEDMKVMERYHKNSAHKRNPPICYDGGKE